jgi:predicted Zn-dependent protease
VLCVGPAVERIFRQAFFYSNKLYAAPKQIQQNSNNNYYYNENNNQQEGNDFEMMLNKKVISRSISIKSITGEEFYKGQRLNGYYPVDAEGVVPDKELMLIDNGVLRNLLNGRKPTKKIQHSNGHVRSDYNSNNCRVIPGNILISSTQTFSEEELRKKLIEAAKEEDLEYAYIIYDLYLNRISKIYVSDGHEEIVRGAQVSDINIKTFKRIIGASDKEQIYSFDTPQATVIFPDAMLFEEIDITRTPNIEFKKPYIVSKPE